MRGDGAGAEVSGGGGSGRACGVTDGRWDLWLREIEWVEVGCGGIRGWCCKVEWVGEFFEVF